MSQDKNKHKVLVTGSSNFSGMIKENLAVKNHELIIVNDEREALDIIHKERVDLVMIGMSNPDDENIIIKEIQEAKLRIPFIVHASGEIENYLGFALKYRVGNLLRKSFKDEELKSIVNKLMDQEKLIDLTSYLDIQENEIKRLYASSSDESKDLIKNVLDYANEKGMSQEKVRSMQLILNEACLNALYHAHGFHEEKMNGIKIHLNGDDKVQVDFAVDNEMFGVSITDFKGLLTIETVIKTLKDFIDNNEKLLMALASGEDPTEYMKDSGRGFHIVFEESDEFYVNILPNKFTQIIFLVSLTIENENNTEKSLKINELAR